MVAAKTKEILKIDYNQVEQHISDNRLKIYTQNNFPGAMNRVYDFSKFALENKGVKFVQAVWLLSMYGVYYYYAVSPHGIKLLASVFSTFFMGFGVANAGMMKNLSVASLTVLPDGEHLRFQLFNGRLFDVPIKDCTVFGIRKSYIDLHVIASGKRLKVMVDTNPSRPKETNDPFLLLGLSHPDVHSVEFQRSP